MPTPFGTIYSSNITPDRETGIGTWTADQFYGTMHTGRFPDGGLIYPAMPFGSYTKVTRADSDAIFAYLRSVPPVHQPNRPHDLRFPYNNRQLILGWRTLFFNEGEYQPDPTKSAEWNRGAYLVEGLGHCAMCHSPINALGGSSESKAFEGGLIPMQNWYAPSLTSNKEAGLGEWSIEEIVDLLRNGVSHRGAVYGPMAEVTFNSLQYLTDADIRAMAIYLKSLGQGSPLAPGGLGDSGPREQPVAEFRPDRLRDALRELPCHRRSRHAARLSAARRQSVDPDGIGREPDPHGAQRRLPARHGRQPDALRHAALRADALRRRGRRRRDLYPRRLGQSRRRRSRRARPTSCARRLWIDAAMINSEPATDDPVGAAEQEAAVNAILRSGAKGAVVLAGLATAVVVAIWFAFYLLVFLPRAIGP